METDSAVIRKRKAMKSEVVWPLTRFRLHWSRALGPVELDPPQPPLSRCLVVGEGDAFGQSLLSERIVRGQQHGRFGPGECGDAVEGVQRCPTFPSATCGRWCPIPTSPASSSASRSPGCC